MSSVPPPPRSALLACWTTAWLSAEVSLAELVAHATQYDDSHVVEGLSVDALDLEKAVGRLRADAVTRVRLVLPVPGDPLGLPGPGPFTQAALHAGEGVVALRPDGSGFGLVPSIATHGSQFDGTVTTVTWTAWPVDAGVADPGPFLHDAEHDLRVGISEATEALIALDVARWDPDVADALADLRTVQRRGITDEELPESWPTRARELLVRTRALTTLVQLADHSADGAIDSRETQARASVLRDLARVVRRARVAAYNAHGPVT